MTKLLKCDLLRVIKDRLFWVVCILAAVFALITPLLYAAIYSGIDAVADGSSDVLELMGLGMDGKTIFFSAFSLSNNFGLIVPVLLAIILCKDFSYGTVRNKIICGCSRVKIFASMYLTCAVFLVGTVLLNALASLGVGLIFFPYSSQGFGAEAGYFFASLGLELLVLLFVSALVCFLCVWAKNAGLAVVLYAAAVLVFTMVTSILMVGELALGFAPENEILPKVFEFVRNVNVFGYSTVIGTGTEYSPKTALWCVLSPSVGTAALLGLGALVFGKKDIK